MELQYFLLHRKNFIKTLDEIEKNNKDKYTTCSLCDEKVLKFTHSENYIYRCDKHVNIRLCSFRGCKNIINTTMGKRLCSS